MAPESIGGTGKSNHPTSIKPTSGTAANVNTVTTDPRAGDLTLALSQATQLYDNGRFDALAELVGEDEAAHRVTQTADVFVAWLRRIVSIDLQLVAIEEQNTGAPVPNPLEGNNPMAVTLDTSQQARFDINARDDRGFLNKASLDLQVTGDFITAEIIETPDPAQPNQLLVVATGTGAGATVVLDVPNDETVPPASEAFDVNPGGITTLALGTPVIEEQPVPEPPAPPV